MKNNAKNSEPVVIDFLDFDVMRVMFQELAVKHKWPISKGNRTPYEYSTFYIGRGVTRFSFVNIRARYVQTLVIIKALKDVFPDYIIRYSFGSINIYLRGDTHRKK